jgi:hypothetical protein
VNLPSPWKSRRAFAAALFASSALAPMLSRPAQAQLFNQFLPANIYGEGVEPDVTVASRIRTGYEPIGIHAGTFTIRPLVTESVGYESNVLGLSHARGSTLLQTNASVDATSQSSRGSVNTGLSVTDNRYFDLANQSFTNWNARVGGTYSLGEDTVSVVATHENLNQTQRDLDVPQLDAPLPYTVDTIHVDYRAAFNRLSLTPSFETARYSFDSGLTGNRIYDQSYRNRIIVTPGIVAAYEFATRRSAVIVVRDTTAFFANGSATNPKRNFNDISVLAGIDYDLNGLLRARALIGYESRSFLANIYQTIQAPIAELSLIYNPTGLTTITATVARRIQDSADETTAGVTTLSANLRLDHEFRRNVLLTASGGISQNDYNVGGSQTLYTANLGLTYLLNRYAALAATYDFTARSGTTTALNLNGFSAGANFVDHRVLLQLKLSL